VFEEMVVNMEWGAFDKERRVLPFTIYDNKLDRESINPQEQLFEKMMSGMYLGEIVRNILLQYIDERVLFSGESSPDLNKQWSFETSYLSTIIDDRSSDLEQVRHILEEILSVPSTTLGDRQVVQVACIAVARRAARLAACGTAGVLVQTNQLDKSSVVAIDGSVYEFIPNFEDQMMETLQELFGDHVKEQIEFTLARDGSGFGAAMIAMMAHKAALVKANQV
jgi:hexokinase